MSDSVRKSESCNGFCPASHWDGAKTLPSRDISCHTIHTHKHHHLSYLPHAHPTPAWDSNTKIYTQKQSDWARMWDQLWHLCYLLPDAGDTGKFLCALKEFKKSSKMLDVEFNRRGHCDTDKVILQQRPRRETPIIGGRGEALGSPSHNSGYLCHQGGWQIHPRSQEKRSQVTSIIK